MSDSALAGTRRISPRYVCALDSQNKTTAVLSPWCRPTRPAAAESAADGAAARARRFVDRAYDGTAWRRDRPVERVRGLHAYRPGRDPHATASRSVVGAWSAGTTLFNVAVSPAMGRVYVTNQEASNEVRFEENQQGQSSRRTASRMDPGSGTPTPGAPELAHQLRGPRRQRDRSERRALAIPTDVQCPPTARACTWRRWARARSALDANGAVLRRIVVGDGPSGLALDETRTASTCSTASRRVLAVVDLTTDGVTRSARWADPSAPAVVTGRHLLYDAELLRARRSGLRELPRAPAAMDNIAWDLGDPQGTFASCEPAAPRLRASTP